jgi:hypothetical protein
MASCPTFRDGPVSSEVEAGGWPSGFAWVEGGEDDFEEVSESVQQIGSDLCLGRQNRGAGTFGSLALEEG